MASYISEIERIKCRVCKKDMLKKNYKTHLATIHPDEDKKDRSGYGQNRIATMFSKIIKKDEHMVSEQPEDVCIVGESSKRKIESDSSVEMSKKRHESGDSGEKRRHESGDSGEKKRHESGDSGFGDNQKSKSDIAVMIPPPQLHESSYVTNNELGAKLDTLIQSVEELKLAGPITRTIDKKADIDIQDDDDTTTLVNIVKHARSMDKILSCGFSYNKDTETVTCSICNDGEHSGLQEKTGQFVYAKENGMSFEETDFLPRKFSMLKKSLVRYIQTRKAHSLKIRDKEEKEMLANEWKNKNQVAGMNLGRLCMKNFILGRPYSDYEYDVLVSKMNGISVGELNHSRKFPAAFRSSVCEVVHMRGKRYLQTPLKQTGFLPPVCLSADKGTFKHRSRQFLSCLTVMPGGNILLKPLTCGQPVVTEGSSGIKLTKNMKSGIDDFGISAEQIESAVFDGV